MPNENEEVETTEVETEETVETEEVETEDTTDWKSEYERMKAENERLAQSQTQTRTTTTVTDDKPWEFDHLNPEKSLAEYGQMLMGQFRAERDNERKVETTIRSTLSNYSEDAKNFVLGHATGLTAEMLEQPATKEFLEVIAKGYEAKNGKKKVVHDGVEPHKAKSTKDLSPALEQQLREMEAAMGLPEGHMTLEKARKHHLLEEN